MQGNNRHERRAALKVGAILVDIGRLMQRDANYGLPVDCLLCGTKHAAAGLARIQKRSTTHVPLCDPCLTSGDDVTDRIARRYLNAPDLVIRAARRRPNRSPHWRPSRTRRSIEPNHDRRPLARPARSRRPHRACRKGPPGHCRRMLQQFPRVAKEGIVRRSPASSIQAP
jgi:hypothetical protein